MKRLFSTIAIIVLTAAVSIFGTLLVPGVQEKGVEGDIADYFTDEPEQEKDISRCHRTQSEQLNKGI